MKPGVQAGQLRLIPGNGRVGRGGNQAQQEAHAHCPAVAAEAGGGWQRGWLRACAAPAGGAPAVGEGVRLVSPALGLPTNSLGDLELHVAPPGLSFLIWRSEKRTPTLLSSQVTPCLRCWDGVSINHLLLSEG